MNIESLREYCLSKKGASESFPFDVDIIVFKVMGKMFAFAPLTPKCGNFFVNLKCEPDYAIELREKYAGVVKGYHMNAKYWNSVFIENDVPDNIIKKLIDHSLEEVIKKLPKKSQQKYLNNDFVD